MTDVVDGGRQGVQQNVMSSSKTTHSKRAWWEGCQGCLAHTWLLIYFSLPSHTEADKHTPTVTRLLEARALKDNQVTLIRCICMRFGRWKGHRDHLPDLFWLLSALTSKIMGVWGFSAAPFRDPSSLWVGTGGGGAVGSLASWFMNNSTGRSSWTPDF